MDVCRTKVIEAVLSLTACVATALISPRTAGQMSGVPVPDGSYRQFEATRDSSRSKALLVMESECLGDRCPVMHSGLQLCG